jgi:hypothetical protein
LFGFNACNFDGSGLGGLPAGCAAKAAAIIRSDSGWLLQNPKHALTTIQPGDIIP